jgi:REP element-mobilizing transposase RayT
VGLRGRRQFTEENTFFITTTVVEFAPVFAEEMCSKLLIDNIKYYQSCSHTFSVLGFVIMPTHFHWIIRLDPRSDNISNIMRDIKKYTAWDVMTQIEVLGRKDLLRIFRRNAPKSTDQKRKLWMKRFDDEIIRNYEMFLAKLEYIHQNPVKAGLVSKPEEFKYSSARNYAFGDHSVLEVNTSFI